MFNEAGGDTAYCSAGGWLAPDRKANVVRSRTHTIFLCKHFSPSTLTCNDHRFTLFLWRINYPLTLPNIPKELKYV
jgi:hypothetical protein